VSHFIFLIVIAGCLYSWFISRRRAASIADTLAPPALQKLSGRSAGLGFLPEDQLDTERAQPPGPALREALDAARNGDPQPAADLLTATGDDWETRTLYVSELSGAAADDDAWLLRWESAHPGDPDAAVVRAGATVQLAGRLLDGGPAGRPGRDGSFQRMVEQARGEIARARELNPADPTPRIAEISVAQALSYPHEQMRELWSEVVALAPHHYAAHYNALQYWCQKWQGSAELAAEFAAEAARSAPRGSLLTALPLISWYEHEASGHTDRGFRTPEVSAFVDALAADVAAAQDGHPRLREARLLLTWYLVRLARYREALEQFRIVDGQVGAFPWTRQKDPANAYVTAREETVRRTA
jgi:hypothetical protein